MAKEPAYAPPPLLTPQNPYQTSLNHDEAPYTSKRLLVRPAGTLNDSFRSNSTVSTSVGLEPVQVSDLPLLNVIDLTKRSENNAKLKNGLVNTMDDLEI